MTLKVKVLFVAETYLLAGNEVTISSKSASYISASPVPPRDCSGGNSLDDGIVGRLITDDGSDS